MWRSGPHLIHGSLRPPESTSQTASRSVRSFLHSLQQNVPILYNGPPFSPSKLSLPLWMSAHRRIHNPNGISSAIFAGLTIGTEDATPPVTVGCIYIVVRCGPVSRSSHERSYPTSGPVSTGMGDRLWAGIPSRYLTSQLGQLSLVSLRGREIEYRLRLG